MILQSSLGDYVFQAFVLGQPLFFMWLYETDFVEIREGFRWSYYIITATIFMLIYQSEYSVGFYTNKLFLQYIVFTVLATYLFNQRYDIKQAISLAFLTVFLNSYYWELPLHLAEILSGQLHPGMIVQLWRLIPVIFFLKHYKFNALSRVQLSLGLLLSTALMFTRYYRLVDYVFFPYLHPLNRVFCLLILVKVIIEATHILNINKTNEVIEGKT